MINKKDIKKLNKDETYSILVELIKLNKENEKFVELKLNNNNEEALAHYKNKIDEFKPKLLEIINRSCEGWGHKDILTEIYEGLRSKN